MSSIAQVSETMQTILTSRAKAARRACEPGHGVHCTPCHPSVSWKLYQATDVPWSANIFTRKYVYRKRQGG